MKDSVEEAIGPPETCNIHSRASLYHHDDAIEFEKNPVAENVAKSVVDNNTTYE